MTRTRTTDEYNQPIIQEFRENGGKVGGIFEKFNMLLLHTIGVKSGKGGARTRLAERLLTSAFI